MYAVHINLYASVLIKHIIYYTMYMHMARRRDIVKKEYAVYVDLKAIAVQKSISIYEIAKRTEITYQNLLALANNKTTAIKWETLERLCQSLDCEPGDIIKIKK